MVIFLFNDTIDISVDNKVYTLNAWVLELKYPTDGLCSCEIGQFSPYFIIAIVQLLSILVASIAFFSYTKRKRQIKLIKIAEYLFALTVIIIIYATISVVQYSSKSYSIIPQIGGLFFLSGIIWLFLAKLYIKKDEHLVQASDRLL